MPGLGFRGPERLSDVDLSDASLEERRADQARHQDTSGSLLCWGGPECWPRTPGWASLP